MASVLATLTVCALCLPRASGKDWMNRYMEGIKEEISMHGLRQFPEKSHGRSSHRIDLVCPDMSPSAETPIRADRVRPADVKVVAGLGDSLTTGIGANATNVLEIPTEYRHFSWSIGGYGNLTDVITLPNILKVFNPNVVGFATRSTVSYKPPPPDAAGLNLAVTGANTFKFPEQARNLIDTLRALPGISFEDDWKLVTIFIGGNDLCDYCKNKTLFSADAFIHNVEASLDMLRDELPRAIINVVQLLQIGLLRHVNDKSFGCLLQKVFCSCVVQPEDNSPELLEVLDQNNQFQEQLEHLILRSGRYEGKRDFAVVLQPFLKNILPPIDQNGSIDYSYFAPDCFHPTIKGHEQMAIGLWNNMLQPEGEKYEVKTFSEEMKILCPSETHPYIYTRTQESKSGASCALRGHPLEILVLFFFVLFSTSP